MTNEIQNPNDKKYDLEERTAKFGEDVIEFVVCRKLWQETQELTLIFSSIAVTSKR